MAVPWDIAGEDGVAKHGLARKITEGFAGYEQRMEFGPIQMRYEGSEDGWDLKGGDEQGVVNAWVKGTRHPT